MAASLARELAGQLFGPLEQCARILALALGHADGLRIGIALGAHPVRVHLRRLATFFERAERGHVEVEPATLEIRGDRRGIGAQLFGVEHLRPFVNSTTSAAPLPSSPSTAAARQPTTVVSHVRNAASEGPSNAVSSAKAEYVVNPPNTPVIQKSRALSALAPRPATYIYMSPMAKLPSTFTVSVGTGQPPGLEGQSRYAP